MPHPPCEVCGGLSFEQLFSKEHHSYKQCATCELIRIDPQPTDATLAGIYGSHYYKAWGVDKGADHVFGLKKSTFRKHVFNRVTLSPGARVLDCGAAFGALMAAAADEGWTPYGIELAEDAARQIGERFGADRIFSGPFENATFPGLQAGDFDAVFMCDFIEHVRDPRAVLQKAFSLLKPGGQLAITTPDGGSLSCRLMSSSWPHYKTEHLFYFSQKNLPILLEQLGMTTTHAGSASKVLDLAYIQSQFNTYPRLGVTQLVNLTADMLGSD